MELAGFRTGQLLERAAVVTIIELGFGAVLAPTLMQYQMSGQGQPLGWVLSVLVTALWLAYGALLWSKPWFPKETAGES